MFLAGLAGEDAPFEPGDRPESGKVTRSGGGMAKPVAMLQSGPVWLYLWTAAKGGLENP